MNTTELEKLVEQAREKIEAATETWSTTIVAEHALSGDATVEDLLEDFRDYLGAQS